tara:strand:- start:33 stop:161 length:129 start_codon:yes stop_codon:yes gene_type:complete
MKVAVKRKGFYFCMMQKLKMRVYGERADDYQDDNASLCTYMM